MNLDNTIENDELICTQAENRRRFVSLIYEALQGLGHDFI